MHQVSWHLEQTVLERFSDCLCDGEKGFVARFRAYFGTLLQYGIGFMEYYRIYFQSLVAISVKARRI
jgi:hypothetical protein